MAAETELLPQPRHRLTVVDIAMISVALTWGINASVVKAAMAGWHVLAFNAIRFSAAAFAIFGYVVLTDKQWRLSRGDLWRVAVLGLVGSGLYQWLFIEGIARSTASNTALIVATSPLVVTLWGAVTGLERFSAWLMAGVAISFGGVAMVIMGQAGGLHFTPETLAGDLIILGAMFCWAAYTVYVRPVIDRVGSPMRVTAWAMLFGAFANLLLGLPGMLAQDYSAVTAGSWLGMAFSGGMALVFSYLIYGWAVKRVGSARTAIYINLTPIIAAVTAWIWLGESWAPLQWVGAVLVIVGLYVAKLDGMVK